MTNSRKQLTAQITGAIVSLTLAVLVDPLALLLMAPALAGWWYSRKVQGEKDAEIASLKAHDKPRQLSFEAQCRSVENLARFRGQRFRFFAVWGPEAEGLLETLRVILLNAGWEQATNRIGGVVRGATGVSIHYGAGNPTVKASAVALASLLREEDGLRESYARRASVLDGETVVDVCIGEKTLMQLDDGRRLALPWES